MGQVEIAPSRLHHGAERLFRREEELAALDKAWSDPTTHLLTIVAWGGVGKTSLVVEWMARLAANEWRVGGRRASRVESRGPNVGEDTPALDSRPSSLDSAPIERVFDWSFYSQGTREQGAAAADTFIAAALEFFGGEEGRKLASSPASPWDKGARLAQLIGQRRSLLVLDGLEPLQHPPGPLAGQLRDPALASLLRGLAQRNPGLCLVTSRERVADLAPFRDTTAPVLQLQHLSTPASVELLKTLGVRGTEAEFQRLVEDVAGHALTLSLLGRYLAKAYRGDIRRRDQVKFEKADAKVQGGHAFRVIAAYERWFEEDNCRKELAILRMLGLFDRPATPDCLAALRDPPITGLTDALASLTEEDWNEAVANLVELNLVEEQPWEPRRVVGYSEEEASMAKQGHKLSALGRNFGDVFCRSGGQGDGVRSFEFGDQFLEVGPREPPFEGPGNPFIVDLEIQESLGDRW